MLSSILFAASLGASPHTVSIGPGLVYSPATLVIAAGDSVRFPASDAHPLSADDDRFLCFSDCTVRFDRVGSFGYHCTTHGVPGARIAGRIQVVEGNAAIPPTSSLSGTWYDPRTPGQGLFVDVADDGFMAIAWFTWTVDGRHDWLLANRAATEPPASMTLLRASGGRFDAPDPISTTPVGNATLRFLDCERGVLTYRRDDRDLDGEISLRRLTPAPEACGAILVPDAEP
jgi:hypothetical protein